MRVFVWIFCISDLVWVDPVFVDCQRSCICGLSPGFVDDQDLLERLSGAFASPRLRSVRLSRRLSVCHTRAQILKSASAASKNVDNVDKICPKSSRARGGSPMLWLTARHPGAIHGKRRRVEYLTCFKIISEKNWIDQITLNRPPNQPWTITRRSQDHLRSFHIWQTSRSPVYRTLICTLPSSWLYMLCAQHPIEALNCMRQRYSFVFARVTSPLYCLLRSRDLKFESYEAELEQIDLSSKMSLYLIVIRQKTCMPVPTPL